MLYFVQQKRGDNRICKEGAAFLGMGRTEAWLAAIGQRRRPGRGPSSRWSAKEARKRALKPLVSEGGQEEGHKLQASEGGQEEGHKLQVSEGGQEEGPQAAGQRRRPWNNAMNRSALLDRCQGGVLALAFSAKDSSLQTIVAGTCDRRTRTAGNSLLASLALRLAFRWPRAHVLPGRPCANASHRAYFTQNHRFEIVTQVSSLIAYVWLPDSAFLTK